MVITAATPITIPRTVEELVAFIGYGHNFPDGEEIPPDVFASRFNPPKVIGESGEIALSPGADNRRYVTNEKLPDGNYLVTTENKPSFSTSTAAGYEPKPKNEVGGAVACSQNHRFGKEALVLGSAKYSGLAARPVGQALEIVPQADPSKIKAGEPFPVKVFFKGSPLAATTVSAYVAGVVERNAAIFFQANTNKEGLVNILPLKGGDWLAKATVVEPYSDKNICDNANYTASFTFKVSD